MSLISKELPDEIRSRLYVYLRKLGGGKLNIYAITERPHSKTIVLAVSTCSEEALKLIREKCGLEWNLGNTACRSIQRNVDAEPDIISAFTLNHA